MAECECMSGCPFFNDRMQGLEVIKDMMKKRFCLGDNTHCARYIVFKTLGGGNVPPDLVPHDEERAKSIVAAAGFSTAGHGV